MRQAMILHDQLVEAAVEENSGMLVRPRGEGDSRFAVFRRASDAVAAAAQVVELIKSATWTTPEPIRVRVGVHTGEADLRDGDYYGTAVNLCARVRGLAGTNQVFVSEATGQLLMRSDSEVELRDVGAHQLKGIARPEHVYALEAAFPVTSNDGSHTAPTTASSKPWLQRIGRSRLIVGAVTLAVIVAVIAGLLVSGSHGGTTAATPPPMPHGYTPVFAKTSCEKDITSELATATCGTLVVPQDRSTPTKGPKVHIAVTIAPPLAGVPAGASPTIDIGGADSLVDSPVRARSELIQIVPRGVAPDTPVLSCPGVNKLASQALALPEGTPTMNASFLAAFSSCRSDLMKAGIDPADYNYDTMADDVVDLMAVMRIPQVDIVTSDNLSHVAYGVLAKVSGSVRTLTLDNPEPAGLSNVTDPVADLASSFQHYADLCAADAHCNAQFSDLGATYEALQHQFSINPVLAETTELTPNASVLLDGDAIGQAIQQALFDSSYYPVIASGVAQAPHNLLASLVAEDNNFYDGNGTLETDPPWGLDESLNCSYMVQTYSGSASLSAQQLPAFAGVAVQQTLQQNQCKVWKVPTLPNSYFAGVGSLVPTLIVRGSITPNGNNSWPDLVKQSLQSATIGQFATLGESVLQTAPPCLASLRKTFLAHPSAHLDMAACTAQSPPISFEDTP